MDRQPTVRQDSRPSGATAVPIAFGAGTLAVLTVHQPLLALLHRAGLAPWHAWAMQATAPFGVPAFVSAALWGGVWAIPLHMVVYSAPTTAAGWRRGAFFGAVAPTALGALLLALGHGEPVPAGAAVSTATAGLAINLCWALAALAFMKFFQGRG